jgi:serine protease inhibitor
VELPYNRTNPNTNDITFVAILPTQNIENALGTMLNKMTPEIFSQMLTRTYRDQVDVWLPKFTIEQTTGLGSILNDMGFGQMFSHDADFSGFSETTKVLFSDAIHKAKIEVDELGTTAAAGTGLTLQSIPSLFIAEHPFFYMVYDHTAKMILFAGVYRGPE